MVGCDLLLNGGCHLNGHGWSPWLFFDFSHLASLPGGTAIQFYTLLGFVQSQGVRMATDNNIATIHNGPLRGPAVWRVQGFCGKVAPWRGKGLVM